MPLGLNMGPSTASTATMFSFASSNSQMDNQSAYCANNPYAQQAKPADAAVSLPSGGKSKGLSKALSGLGKRFGSSSKKGVSMQEVDLLAEAAAKSAAAVTMAAATSLDDIGDLSNHFNSDPVSDRNYSLSEAHALSNSLNPHDVITAQQQHSAAFFANGGLPAIQAVVVGKGIRTSDARSVGSMGPAKKKTKSAPTKVQHQYQDYSNVTDEDALQDAVERKNTGGVVTPFPEKLHDMLSANTETDVIDWAPHGRCFVIKKPKVFAATIMPKHFKHTKITSFQRQLNLYGFKRITKGKDRGAYYHELFLRGRAKLSTKMRRQRIKGVGHKPLPDPENEPDFYSMEPLDPPVQSNTEDQPSDAVSLSQLSGGLSLPASVHSGGLQSIAASLPSVHSGDIANACAMSVNSFPQSVLSASGLSTASPGSLQQAQMLGIVAQQQQQIGISGASMSGASQQSDELRLLSQLLEQQRQQIEQQQRQLQQRQQQLLQEELVIQQEGSLQQAQMLGIVAQQQQQIGISGASMSGASQQSDELRLLSQLLEQQRQQIEQQQRQLQQRQQQLLQEELVLQQKEVLLLQQQQLQQKQRSTQKGLQAPAVVSSVQMSQQHKRQPHTLQLTPANMNVNIPANCDATIADMSAVSGAEFSEVGMLEIPAALSGVNATGTHADVVSSSKMPPPAARTDSALSTEPIPHILQNINAKRLSQPKEDPSVGLFSLESGSKRSARRGVTAANKSMGSLSKRLSVKSWGSVGSASRASRTSSRKKMPWSRRSLASASSNGSDAWLDEEQKVTLEATIDFDSIFEGAGAH
mmetsp:Transcript_52167/g.156565  ORF Transcript_52167/g.156565 Transcript_52167/m.156565 type:complete len:809 (-) Transcript_52167:208-2634(-)